MINSDTFVHFINRKCKCDKNKTDYEKKIFKNINNTIVHKKMKPILRIVYNRTTFENKNIKITFDSDLYSFKEYTINSKHSFNKYDVHLNNDDIMNLNYGILEIKTNGIELCDIPIIKDLIDNNYIEEVQKFSKYLTCCYNLYDDVLINKPYWYDTLNIVKNEGIDRKNTDSIEEINKITKYPIVINPSTVISNERLFLKWLMFGLKFIFLAFILKKNNIINNLLVYLMILLSIGVSGFSVFRFFDNYNKLSKKEPLNNSRYIPILFGCISLIIDIMIAYLMISKI